MINNSHKCNNDLISEYLVTNTVTKCRTIYNSTGDSIKTSKQSVTIFNPTENKKQKRIRTSKQLSVKKHKAKQKQQGIDKKALKSMGYDA